MLILRNLIDLKTRIRVNYAYFFQLFNMGLSFGHSYRFNKNFENSKENVKVNDFLDLGDLPASRMLKDLQILTVPNMYTVY